MIYYDEEIDPEICIILRIKNSLRYKDLKKILEERLGRTVSHDAFVYHLKELEKANSISKEDQGRGRPVLYNLTANQRNMMDKDLRMHILVEVFYWYIGNIILNIEAINIVKNIEELLEDYNTSLKELEKDFERKYYTFEAIPNDDKVLVKIIATTATFFKELEKGLRLVCYSKKDYIITKNIIPSNNFRHKNFKLSDYMSIDILHMKLQNFINNKHITEFHLIPEHYQNNFLDAIYLKIAQDFEITPKEVKDIIENKDLIEGNKEIIKTSPLGDNYFEFGDRRFQQFFIDIKNMIAEKQEIEFIKYVIFDPDDVNITSVMKARFNDIEKNFIKELIFELSEENLEGIKSSVFKRVSEFEEQRQILKERYTDLLEKYELLSTFFKN